MWGPRVIDTVYMDQVHGFWLGRVALTRRGWATWRTRGCHATLRWREVAPTWRGHVGEDDAGVGTEGRRRYGARRRPAGVPIERE